MRHITSRDIAIICCLVLASNVESYGDITFENKTDELISIWLQGTNDRAFKGPWAIHKRTEITINVPSGQYYVAAKRQNGFEYMGWKDYTNNKITYALVQCIQCNPGGAVVETPTTTVYHASGTYVCPKCGRIHVKWAAGWDAEEAKKQQGNSDEHGVFRPDFEPQGTYRLGVSVSDGGGGVTVIGVNDGTAATRMHRVDVADGTDYQLTPGLNVITHVNGERVHNTTEFTSAGARSSKTLQVRVFNTERNSTRDYQTELAY